MAGVIAKATSGEVSVAASTAKTVLLVTAGANHRAKASGLSVMCKGIVSTDTPIRVRVGRCSTAGTPGAGATIVKNNSADDETIQTSVGGNFSAEPTYTDILETWEVHPQTGIVVFYPFGSELMIPGGTRLAIEVLAAQNQTVVANLTIDE